MVSISPNTQSYNFTHMFDMVDYRGCQPKIAYCPTSIMGIIDNNPDFTKFKYMLKLAKLDRLYDQAQANYTLFVVSDHAIAGLGDEVFTNMDSATARHIIKSSTLDRRISSDVLRDSPAAYFMPKDDMNRLFVTNMSGQTYINNETRIIKFDIIANNGLIHVVDQLMWPYIV